MIRLVFRHHERLALGRQSGLSAICKDWLFESLLLVTEPERTVRLPRALDSTSAVWLLGAKPPKMVSWQLS